MSLNSCEIKRHEHCDCYTLSVDGKFCGNFDTVKEAAAEFDRIWTDEQERIQLQEEAAIDNLIGRFGEVPA